MEQPKELLANCHHLDFTVPVFSGYNLFIQKLVQRKTIDRCEELLRSIMFYDPFFSFKHPRIAGI